MLLSVFSICALFALPGYLAVVVMHRKRGGLSLAEMTLTAATFGLLVVSMISHTLGALGVFSPRAMWVGWGAICASLVVAAVVRRAHPLVCTPTWTDGWLAILLALLGAVYVPGVSFLFGSADEGVYLNTAAQLVREGTFWIPDDFPERDWGLRALRSGTFLPGYYFADETTVAPHGFYFYPAYLASLWAVGGLKLASTGPAITMLLSLLALFVLVSRLGNRFVGLLVAGVVGVSPMSVWFSRFTYAEGLSEALLLSGFALLVSGWSRAEDDEGAGTRRLWLALAGLALGAVHLVKVEFLLLPPFVIVFAIIAAARGELRGTRRTFLYAYGLTLAVAGLHAATTHRVYFLAQVRDFTHLYSFGDKVGLPTTMEYVAAMSYVPILAVFGLILFRFRRFLARVWAGWSGEAERGRGWRIAIGLVAVGAVTVLLLGETRTGRTLWGVVQYLTLPGLFAAVIGLALLVLRKGLPVGLLLAFGLVQTLFLFAIMHTSIDWGSNPHFLAYRRFLCISVPLLMTCAIVPWFYEPRGRLAEHKGLRVLLRSVGVAIALYVGGYGALKSLPHVQARPWKDVPQTVRWITQRGGDDVVWIAAEADLTVTRLLTPIRMLHGQPALMMSLHHNHVESLRIVVAKLREQGKQPIVVFSNGWRWHKACCDLFQESGTLSYIVEHVARHHPDRIPDERERYEWTYSVCFFGLQNAPPTEGQVPSMRRGSE